MFGCLECGHRFRGLADAERAVFNGCPECGGSDIDLVPPKPPRICSPPPTFPDRPASTPAPAPELSLFDEEA